ncbi:hypothetical protein L6654_21845 [Bradyrhizobium sp. WYCCWR 13023]|uniref:Uncharacterized protein n=1 Tax=Bradyrhizobium zhengyangense TaxID=2911009 RepID=A0A9X1R8K3_9BRAD|nr:MULTISPECIES: hypothetical protein [Bradyrhizobium]MCG2629287.1 hypothetical protein [Bradyrhizobium zhengyangense]MCG2640730.1 hypothetical protein [Bradyrhizobium zhengyangense]
MSVDSRETNDMPRLVLSVLEMEHSRVELDRHKESSSKLQGSTDPKISVKWRGPAVFGQHHVSLWPRSRPFFALKRFELREDAHNVQLGTGR